MKVLLIILILFPFDSQACKPKADFVAPSIAENYKNAEMVFRGKIIAHKQLGRSIQPFGMKHQIEFLVEKNIKGTKEKKISLNSYSNTCDTFAQNVAINSECLIFVDRDLQIISGVLSGESSLCDDPKGIHQKIKELESLK